MADFKQKMFATVVVAMCDKNKTILICGMVDMISYIVLADAIGHIRHSTTYCFVIVSLLLNPTILSIGS